MLDTRPATAVGPTALVGETWAGEIRRLPVVGVAGVPDGATDVPIADGQTVVVDAASAPGVVVPDDARGVMWNLTVVNAERRGFVTGWATSAPQPATSLLNWSLAGEVRAAAAVTAVSSGRASFRLDDQGAPGSGPLGHLLVDVFGYFT